MSSSSNRQAVPGDVFDSSDTLLYNQSLIVYTPNNSFTRELMDGVKTHTAFNVSKKFSIHYPLLNSIYNYNSQEVGGFLPLPSEDDVDALFEENEMLYAAVIFHESETLKSKVRP